MCGFVLVGVSGGWIAAQWIGRRYQERKFSEQSITADAIWLLFTLTYSISLAFEGPAWVLVGLAAFIQYKVCVRFGFALLRNQRVPERDTPRLLLLTVFALGKRSQRLYTALTRYWRHVGRLRVISGPDLATTTIEPDEFFAFLGGRLGTLFIDGTEMLDQRLAGPDDLRDGDGRYQVREFFCSGPIWKTTLVRLAAEDRSDVVLMDLRSFSPRNAGCLFEIEALVNLVSLNRVLFLISDNDEANLLHEKLREFWVRMSPESPTGNTHPKRSLSSVPPAR